jgi:hypothetical protein
MTFLKRIKIAALISALVLTPSVAMAQAAAPVIGTVLGGLGNLGNVPGLGNLLVNRSQVQQQVSSQLTMILVMPANSAITAASIMSNPNCPPAVAAIVSEIPQMAATNPTMVPMLVAQAQSALATWASGPLGLFH